MLKSVFVKKNGRKLPVNERFLTDYLSPTTGGTHHRESAQASDTTDRQHGRVLLQIHQILNIFYKFGIELSAKTMLDIGTGNGLIPRLILELSSLEKAVGTDLFLDGEHQTSWQPHDHDKSLKEIKSLIEVFNVDGRLRYEDYRHLLKYETHTLLPDSIELPSSGVSKSYRFSQVGAHDLGGVGETFDIFYCKAIEHIQNWEGVFDSIRKASNPESVIYFKHRSFYSYLGPHRYSSIEIPWGHLLLSDDEYVRYVKAFHPNTADKILDFYYKGLTYPRKTVSDMVQIASSRGFKPLGIIIEPTKHIDSVLPIANSIDDFWGMISENHPGVSSEEVLSGMYHILFQRID